MGDYSQKTPVETLMVKRAGGVPNDLTGLLLCPRQSMRHSTSEPATRCDRTRPALPLAGEQETSQRLRPSYTVSRTAPQAQPPRSLTSARGGHMTKGQRAMAVAKIYPEPEKLRRKGSGTSATEGLTAERLSTARTVLQYAPDLADSVLSGTRKAPARSRGQG